MGQKYLVHGARVVNFSEVHNKVHSKRCYISRYLQCTVDFDSSLFNVENEFQSVYHSPVRSSSERQTGVLGNYVKDGR